jgi:hypothetical protein
MAYSEQRSDKSYMRYKNSYQIKDGEMTKDSPK